jgi:hypothetical protein
MYTRLTKEGRAVRNGSAKFLGKVILLGLVTLPGLRSSGNGTSPADLVATPRAIHPAANDERRTCPNAGSTATTANDCA